VRWRAKGSYLKVRTTSHKRAKTQTGPKASLADLLGLLGRGHHGVLVVEEVHQAQALGFAEFGQHLGAGLARARAHIERDDVRVTQPS